MLLNNDSKSPEVTPKIINWPEALEFYKNLDIIFFWGILFWIIAQKVMFKFCKIFMNSKFLNFCLMSLTFNMARY